MFIRKGANNNSSTDNNWEGKEAAHSPRSSPKVFIFQIKIGI
jgi:hypothetical protein